jgi:hypothetical protein
MNDDSKLYCIQLLFETTGGGNILIGHNPHLQHIQTNTASPEDG